MLHQSFLTLIDRAHADLSANDSTIGSLIESLGPCDWHSYRMEPFDALVWSVIGQQISVKAVEKIIQRVRHLTGHPITAANLLKISHSELRIAGLSGSKANTVLDLAQQVTENTIAMHEFHELPDDEVMAQICKVKGIGPWTAEMFLIFGLGRLDVFSARDLALRKAVEKAWRLSALPSVAHCEELAQSWRPWRTVASWYLWRTVD